MAAESSEGRRCIRRACALVVVCTLVTTSTTSYAQDAPPTGEGATTPAQPTPPPATPPPTPAPTDAPGGYTPPPPPPNYGQPGGYGAYGGGYGAYGGGYGGYGGGYGAYGGYPGYPGAGYPGYPPLRRELPYEDGMPIPEGARVVERDRPGLWLTGAIVFGSIYLLGGLAALDEDTNLDVLFVPLLGPWLALSDIEDDELRPTLVLSGIGQAVGALLIVLGVVWKRKVLIIDTQIGGRRVSFAPETFGGQGIGLGMTVL